MRDTLRGFIFELSSAHSDYDDFLRELHYLRCESDEDFDIIENTIGLMLLEVKSMRKKHKQEQVTKLVDQFKAYEIGQAESLTYEECSIVLAEEKHEAFMYDHGLYRSIMDFRDHLEMDQDLDGYYENQRMQAYNA